MNTTSSNHATDHEETPLTGVTRKAIRLGLLQFPGIDRKAVESVEYALSLTGIENVDDRHHPVIRLQDTVAVRVRNNVEYATIAEIYVVEVAGKHYGLMIPLWYKRTKLHYTGADVVESEHDPTVSYALS